MLDALLSHAKAPSLRWLIGTERLSPKSWPTQIATGVRKVSDSRTVVKVVCSFQKAVIPM